MIGHFVLNRQRPLRAQLYDLLRRQILTGKIKPGEIIDEKAIAQCLGISRTPVREAVKRLCDEHLVSVVAQSATRAAQLNWRDIEEAYLIRRALEMESVAQASTRMNRQHSRDLYAIIRAQADAIAAHKFERALQQDDHFHKSIALISGLHRLWQTVEVSKAQLDRCRYIMLPRLGEGATTLRHHRKIVRALNTGNTESARMAMKHHLDVSFERAFMALKETDLSFPQAPKPGGKQRQVGATH